MPFVKLRAEFGICLTSDGVSLFCRDTFAEWRHIRDTRSWEYQNFTEIKITRR
jgi:hypothetical protein